MPTFADMRPYFSKAIRIVLVFALVFGTSLHLEYTLAYAFGSVQIDDGSGHEGQELTDLVIYQSAPGEDVWVPVPDASASATETGQVALTDETGEREYVVVPIWDGLYPEEYAEGGYVRELSSATFVDWEVQDEEDCLAVSPLGQSNVLTLAAQKTGDAAVICKAAGDYADTDLGVKFLVSVTVAEESEGEGGEDQPSTPEAIKLVAVQILDDKGQDFADSPAIALAKNDLPAEYQLQAEVQMQNLEAGTVYNSAKDGSLESFSGGLLSNLEWRSSDPEVATVDSNGKVKVLKEGEASISCIAHVVETTEEMIDAISIVAGSPDDAGDPQGASHPQDSLQVYAALGKVKTTAAGSGDALSTQAEGDGEDESGDTLEGDDSPDIPDTGDDSEGEGDAQETERDVTIDLAYSVSELQSLADAGVLSMNTRTYTMHNADGALTIVGNGFEVKDLINHAFEQAGVDIAQVPVESIDFIDYRGVRTKMTWSFFQNTSILAALASRVQTEDPAPSTPPAVDEGDVSQDISDEGQEQEGEEASAEAEGAGEEFGTMADDSDELLDNTRFRMLFNSSSSSFDADALRWIKGIELHTKTVDSDRLAVGISYVPVPIGVEAEFVASPNHNINGRWDCQWESSSDGGLTWKEIDGAVSQTLRVLTSTDTVGTLYRVTIDNHTSVSSGEASESLVATSEPVELQIGGGFAVVLSYNPPKAGDLAIFRSSIYDYPGDVSELDYAWEWSEDGGASWSVIKNENKPTLKIPTEPVSDDASSSDGSGGSTPNLVYIRVRAITPSDEVRVSNAQPLTVHVGDDPSDTGGSDDDGRTDGADVTPGSEAATPSTPTSSGGGGATTPTVTPIQNIVVESTATPSAALDPQGEQVAPTVDAQTGTPSQIYISEDVSAQILEQQEALQEQMNETVPGSRWTKLKTLEPTGDEVRRVLEGNPFVPFVLLFALAFMIAGGLEKLLSFRRQMSDPKPA